MYIVVVSCDQPNTFAKVTCKHNQEQPLASTCSICCTFSRNNSGFPEVPECSFLSNFFGMVKFELIRNKVKR